MRVLITGGTGQIGKATTERLLQKGWDVRILDLAPKTEISGVEYAQANILDYNNLIGHMRDCDAVIHLAAIRAPTLAPKHEVFDVNVTGTFNVFEAAAATGIRKVVQASSINAIGAYYSTGDIYPQYFPIDEEHPSFTTDPYSFSKQLVEEIGAYYWRRDGISSVALRFPGVHSKESRNSDYNRQHRDSLRSLLDELVNQPQSEQQARIGEIKKRVLDLRSHRPLEFRTDQTPPAKLTFDDLLFKLYMTDRFNFWAYIDERDAAQSLEKSLTANYEGSYPLFINAACNSLGYNSLTLARIFFPEVTQFKTELHDSASLISIQKAKSLIGYEPEYS